MDFRKHAGKLWFLWIAMLIFSGCAAPAATLPAATLPAATLPAATGTQIPTIEPTPILSSATPTTTPRPPAQPRELVVYPDQTLQTVREVGGGNFIHYFGQSHSAFEPVSSFNWKTLTPRLVRVGMELNIWEPVNDNADPKGSAAGGFVDQEGDFNRATFEMMRLAKKEKVTIIASIWRVPDWLVENPSDESGQIIPREKYPEVIESIAAWLLHARDEYGVDVDYISFNEANLGIKVLLSPFDGIELIRQAGPRFAELGLETRWLLGDTSNMAETVDYSEWIWKVEDIRPYLGPLAFHSWDSGAADSTMERIGKFADENKLEVWCTEGGWDPSLWQQPEKFPTWTHALSLAAVYTRALKMTRASVFLYWQMSGQDYAINDGSKAYPALAFLTAFQSAFPTGAVVLGTGPDQAAMKFAAAKVEDGYALVVVNVSLKETMRIRGLTSGLYDETTYTREGQPLAVETVEVRDGIVDLEIPGFSITFLTSHKK